MRAETVRALLLTPDFPPAGGGIQLVMSRLASELAGEVNMRVVTLAAGAKPVVPPGVEVRAAGRRGASNKVSNARLNVAGLRAGLASRPDVVIAGHAVAAPAAAAIRSITGARVLQYVHADEARGRPRLLSFAVRRADATVAVSSYARELSIAAGARPARVRVIHPGVDGRETSGRARAEEPTVLTVSRIQEAYKGHDTMVRALPEIRARIPDVRWVVVGDGERRSFIEELAAGEGVSDSIHFTGHVAAEERDRWMDESHVFAMPSRLPDGGVGGEGFGIVYLEAGLHRLPVVAGNVGGALDAVVNGETGLLVDPTDAGALAAAITSLLLDSDRAARLGRQGRERARAFTWDRHAAAVRELMGEVLRR